MPTAQPVPEPPDRVGRTRQLRRFDPAVRAKVAAEHASLIDQLRGIDRSLAALAKERRRLLDRLAARTDELWTWADWPEGRRSGTDSLDDALPPLPEDPKWLFGRRLRATCLRLLQRCGPLPLRQLHALLHLHGFGVAGAHPVKALADALGHEADTGNAFRESRGRYRAAPDYRPRSARHLFLADVVLPDLDE